MNLYRTADGKIFENENDAVTHAKILDYNKQGFEVVGQPYDYSKIDRSEDGGETWI